MTPSPTPKAPAPDPSRIGGRYRIDRVLAEGGMGTVYCVTDERSGQMLALKRVRGAEEPHVLALFEREYRTLAGLSHPRIVRAYEYGVDASGPYYTMELAQGRDLYELSPLPFREACRHLRDVATCLALLHTRRLLHRDVTPRNVRVTPSGECKLLDFGALMSFGIPERTVGTPPCIPPEALKRGPLDQRADVFSFGALLYWTLTRRHAYPAKRIEDLPDAWRRKPPAPSSLEPSIPKAADALLLALLSLDPLARPGSMAEVVERLNMLADLPPETEEVQRALAESYLVQAAFVGRKAELGQLREDLAALDEGRGSATLVTGPSGVGRSRLLSEALVQGQLFGLPSLHVDAEMHRNPHGTALAIVQQLLDISPAARREAAAHATSLAQVDRDLARRLNVPAAAPQGAISGDWRARMLELLHALVTAACSDGRLLLIVDNADEADDGSLALLAGLLRLTKQAPLALVLGVRDGGGEKSSISWRLLRHKSRLLPLSPLSSDEMAVLSRSLFGDAPNVTRFARWLHERTGGLPLHAMELVRRLHASGTIRHVEGLWVLPAERPASLPDASLDGLLLERLDQLSAPALRLAETLAVQRGELSRALCVELATQESDSPFALLDELIRADVLQDMLQGYRFSHAVLRGALLQRMPQERRRSLHLACAQRELQRAGDDNQTRVKIEAGWHFLQAGDAVRGADALADVAYDTVGVRFAFADLQVAAPALEAALAVYTKQGRSIYERLPLMAALAQAGYYEDRAWGERYGDEALSAVSEVSGLSLARKLRPYLGKTLGLLTGMLCAFVRFTCARSRRRGYRFGDVLVQLFGVVTTLTGAASIALDVKRAQQVAATLEPFLHLPARLTPVGIAQFCAALGEIGRENQAHALATWSALIDRFNNPRYYPTLPDRARPLYVGGLWFARGVFESFRDGTGALHAADELDRLDLKLYRMVASALRVLHHANRGEVELARRHREQVEMHAIQIGSAWQVELWEPAAMILVHTTIGDVIDIKRVADRLSTLSHDVPSLQLYAELSQVALEAARLERSGAAREGTQRKKQQDVAVSALIMLEGRPPRSFIGWGATIGYTARALNTLERHEEARELCLRSLQHLTPEDRGYVALFLNIEIELVIAEAFLGDAVGASARMDELLAFHQHSDNPLTRGRLHEAYARIAARMGDWPSYRHHLEETRSWYRRTRASSLIARIPRIEGLDPTRSVPPDTATQTPTLRVTTRSRERRVTQTEQSQIQTQSSSALLNGASTVSTDNAPLLTESEPRTPASES